MDGGNRTFRQYGKCRTNLKKSVVQMYFRDNWIYKIRKKAEKQLLFTILMDIDIASN